MKSSYLLGSTLLFLFTNASLWAQCIPACDVGETCCGSVCVDAALRFKFVDETSARGISPIHTSADNNGIIDGPGIATGGCVTGICTEQPSSLSALWVDFDNDADLDPRVPDGVANFGDVSRDVQAFQGGDFGVLGCSVPCP